MRANQKLLLTLSLFASLRGYAKFEAHEWGTFTSLVGSNGTTQNGMYHEDEELPAFVHGFGVTRAEVQGANPFSLSLAGNSLADLGQPEEPPPPPPTTQPPPPPPCKGKGCFDLDVFKKNIITQKMETPVIYFYSDIKRKVQVNVRFPEGVITETFPAPVRTSPQRQDDLIIANGKTQFEVEVLPALTATLPAVAATNIYSHARSVNSNVVRSGSESEKFIFYRGLGRFQPEMQIRSENGNLSIEATESSKPQALFLVHVDDSGNGQMLNLGPLPKQGRKTISARQLLDLSNHQLDVPFSKVLNGGSMRQALLESLQTAGLYADEAVAMLDTWEHGYLKVPGLRLLYILPRAEVEKVLPLSITPVPDKLERVFVGRIEVMLDTQEQAILSEIKARGPYFKVQSLGRFAEPILRRILEIASPSDKALISGFIEKAATENIGTATR